VKRPLTNVAASVRQRLLNLANQRGEEFQSILVRFANERLIYRLAVSPHAGDFVLKGAMLLYAWSAFPFRATQDVDLLGRGEITAESLTSVFRELCEACGSPIRGPCVLWGAIDRTRPGAGAEGQRHSGAISWPEAGGTRRKKAEPGGTGRGLNRASMLGKQRAIAHLAFTADSVQIPFPAPFEVRSPRNHGGFSLFGKWRRSLYLQ